MKITSLQNDLVKQWSFLKDKKYREEHKVFLVEGEHLVVEALKVNKVNTLIYCYEKPSYFNDNIKTFEVTYEIMKKITSTKTPQQVAAICDFLDENTLDLSIAKLVALDSVQDPGNGGTILRTALALNYDGVLISDDSFDIYNDKFIRSTMGAIFQLKVIRTKLLSTLLFLKSHDYDIIVSTLENDSVDYVSYIPKTKHVLVLGNEGQGVKPDIIKLATKKVKIKINEKIDSLNVAIAGAILMAKYTE